jgi:plasmid stabilization system protein ParE
MKSAGTSSDEPDGSTVYAVRFSPRAEREAAEATVYLAEMTGDPAIGREWYVGLRAATGTLATNPRRCVQIPGPRGARFHRDMRQMVYRRPGSSRSSVAYLVLFTIEDNTPDGPRVTVLHLRHAARKPLTRAEARSIETETEGDASPNPPTP